MDFVDLSFSKAFGTVDHSILIDKLMKHRLDKWTLRWTESWLSCWTKDCNQQDNVEFEASH